MNPCVLLSVDDDTTVLSALQTLLSRNMGSEVRLEMAESGEEALELCDELAESGHALAVVISDFIMPHMRGDELLVRIHSHSPQTVKIMLTGQSDLEGIKRTINEANLYRFLEKPFNNADLLLTARGALQAYCQGQELALRNAQLERINRDLEQIVAERTAELVEKNRQLELLSTSDRLTGLNNRLHLDTVLHEELARHGRGSGHLSVILVDLDQFKAVNDQHGHLVGDQVLTSVAQVLADGVRALDVVGRWGGEEFLVICKGTDALGARHVADKLRVAIATHHFPVVGHKTGSFGVATLRPDESISSLLARADSALYRAKHGGRNRVEVDA